MSQQPNPNRPLTLGEYRVGISFNPSNDPRVNELKGIAAEFIDLCETYIKIHGGLVNDESLRCMRLAQTHIEDAAMWAVKSVTKLPRV